MNDQKLAEANKLLTEAKSYENSSGGFFSKMFGGSSGKLDEAAVCYQRAANQFKAHKQWERAGNAFREAARIQKMEAVSLKHEAAQSLVNAGLCYRKSNPEAAVQAYQEAVAILTDMGRFNMAAKNLASIGEIYNESRDFQKAIEAYNQAADYYRSEESHTTADKFSLIAADLLASEMEQYQPACEIYEMIGNRAADSNLLKYSAKNHFFKAALCHLNIDVINAQQALERYPQILPSFQDTREFILVKSLVSCMEEDKLDEFTEAVTQYDSISRLDDWTTGMLLRAKKQMGGEGDDDLT